MPQLTVKLLKKVDRSKHAAAVVTDAVRDAVMETARATLSDVDQRVPHLRGTYRIETSPDGLTAALAADHSSIEFGTSKTRAQPHLRPAGEAQAGPMRQRLAAAMRKAAGNL